MSEKLTSLAQLRMTAEKSKEMSAQIAAAVAEAIEELDRSKANTAHSHTAADVGALSTSGGTIIGDILFDSGNADTKIKFEMTDGGLDYPILKVSAVSDTYGEKEICTFESLDGMDYAGIYMGGSKVTTESYIDTITRVRGVPSGIIVMWSGAQNNIPAGWVLCNGQYGTPDLRDRFVLGAGNKYAVGAKGGEETHTLSESEMPKHSHTMSESTGTGDLSAGNLDPYYMYYTGFDSGIATESTGGSGPHNNMPPYYALCYIMKT